MMATLGLALPLGDGQVVALGCWCTLRDDDSDMEVGSYPVSSLTGAADPFLNLDFLSSKLHIDTYSLSHRISINVAAC